ncbi:hypothetical protein A9Q99_25700 [Gammaproteobacteria bacterium 45_16_T64]|nr:hypothetical protein A9Q99_25700 [Gammaproteobacteria bacterium 45_16_T64]
MTKQLPKTYFARNKVNILVLDLESNVEIKLVDDEGEPVPNRKYELHLTDDSILEGMLDDDGYALISGENLDGAKVMFPELDEKAWMSESAHQDMNNPEQQA